MYGMTNHGKLFADDLTEWLFEAGFIKSQYQMYIYDKYAPYGKKCFVLSCVDNCVYWYTYRAIRKRFVESLGKRLHLNFLGYTHWFMSIIISQMRDHSISVDQDRYATSIVSKYFDNDKFKISSKFL